MARTRLQLREAFVESGGVSEEVFDQIAQEKTQPEDVEAFLVEQGYLTDEQAGELLANWYGVRFVSLDNALISDQLLGIIPETFARSQMIIPLRQEEDDTIVAVNDPTNLTLKSLLEKYLRTNVRFVFSTAHDIRSNVYRFKKNPKQAFEQILQDQSLLEKAGKSAVVELVDGFFEYAYQFGASDIHIEPEDDDAAVRYRVDGLLQDVVRLPKATQEAVISRLKVLARLAIDEHRAAQDGKIGYETEVGDELEIRISIVPTTDGEKAVMRLLTKQRDKPQCLALGKDSATAICTNKRICGKVAIYGGNTQNVTCKV